MPMTPPVPTKHILVVIRHADDFMRHNLADGQDQIMSAIAYKFVDLRRPFIVEQPPHSPGA